MRSTSYYPTFGNSSTIFVNNSRNTKPVFADMDNNYYTNRAESSKYKSNCENK